MINQVTTAPPRRASMSSRSASAHRSGQKRTRITKVTIPSSDADDEDGEMNDVNTIRVGIKHEVAFLDGRTPALTPDERRLSRTSISSLSSLGEEPTLAPQDHATFFHVTDPIIVGNADVEEKDPQPRASRRSTTMQKTAASSLKPAVVRKPRPPRRAPTPEDEQPSYDVSSSPPRLGFVPSPPRGAESKNFIHQRNKIMKEAETAALLPQTQQSRNKLNKILIRRGKSIPCTMGEIMSMNYTIPTVFLPRGQNIDIPSSRTIAGRKMSQLLDSWIDRENDGDNFRTHEHTDFFTILQSKQRAAETRTHEVEEPKLNARELAVKKAEMRWVEREADWERNIAKRAEDGAYI